MENPFKFGTIVDNEYFTDRVAEQEHVKALLNSPNHLVLISPRRFGKSSLVRKTVLRTGRPSISLNMQQMTSVEDLASAILKGVFKLHQWEKIRHMLANFRIIPTLSVTPLGDAVEVSFQPTTNSSVLLEDALALVERVSDPDNRIIVVFDEFQEIIDLEDGLDKKLRAIMQEQQNVNYVFMGSEESMMTGVFEDKKSPFYHFGSLMRLDKIPYDDFLSYVSSRLAPVMCDASDEVATMLLKFTGCHPYYTQQLASMVWEAASYKKIAPDSIIKYSVDTIVRSHDLDFERLWMSVNKTDRKVLRAISRGQPIYADRKTPTSTIYSSIKKLMKRGVVLRQENYEIEDPFFQVWICRQTI